MTPIKMNFTNSFISSNQNSSYSAPFVKSLGDLRFVFSSRSRGFTLMELMIAIGILGIGAVMAAALFPTAIKENQISNDDTLGRQICQNGLGIVKARYTVTNLPTNPTTTSFKYPDYDGSHPGYISVRDSYYPLPSNDNGAPLGFLTLIRTIDANTYQYQIATASFRKRTTVVNNIPQWQTVTATVPSTGPKDNITITSNLSFLQRETPLIFDEAGEYAVIKAINGSLVTLENELTNTTAGTGKIVWVVYEPGASRSPAIGILVARTGLRN